MAHQVAPISMIFSDL